MHHAALTLAAALLAIGEFVFGPQGGTVTPELARAESEETWALQAPLARLDDGMLTLDGRGEMAKAFYVPYVWDDVSLSAEFMVEPAGEGVLACAFIVRAEDPDTYYFVHFDRTQAILCRADEKSSWNELARVKGLDKPAGEWHQATLACSGNTLTVSLNGEKLLEAEDGAIARGRAGFYANQGLAHVRNIEVTGQAREPHNEFPRPKPMYVKVCEDAGAGGYEAFPDVCRLAGGRLMCVFYAGYGHVALPNADLPKGGRVVCCFSSDEGRTWTPAETVYDGPDDDRDPSIAQLSSGRLLCNFFSLRKVESDDKRWEGLGSWLIHSDDGGHTWSEPRQIAADYYCSSPVRELADGRLMLGLYAQNEEGSWGAVTISADNGNTWSNPIDIDNGGMRLDAETDVIEFEDGTLFAAQRGRDETMGWATSADGGYTWSVSKPFGFRGHCPYLHRTLDGIVLMAHRRPDTSLHYSLDDCRTWSQNVPVDTAKHGAYPSMVTLKDGTTLIVYYEEGDGSDIRARRFLATAKGIDWMPVTHGPLPEATLTHYTRIWNHAPHNAFTSLTRWQGQWWCVFREGQGHVSPDGALRVLRSPDGETWRPAALVTRDDADLRDAQITVTPDGQLMLSGAAAWHDPEDATHQTFAWFSNDGHTWSAPTPIGDPGMWLWRLTWHKGVAYSVGYACGQDRKFARLYRSEDGKHFETLVDELHTEEYPNETCLVFLEDDTCLCLLRRGGTGLIGRAAPPYTDWTWKDLGVRIGGPNFVRLPDGRFVAAVRLYDDTVRTALCWLDPDAGTLDEFLTLPSGGDTSYPGLVWHQGELWISYYASHEGKTSIYHARAAFE